MTITWSTVRTALAAALLVVVAGCSAAATVAPGPHARGHRARAASVAPLASTRDHISVAGAPATPAGQVIGQIVNAAHRIKSLTATMTLSASAGTVKSAMTGTIAERVRPFSAAMVFHGSLGGTAILGGIQTVITAKAVYVKTGALSAFSQRPWLDITPSSVRIVAGASFGPLVRDFREDDPAAQALGLRGATHVRELGHALVAGVPATEYSGSLDPGKAAAKLLPSMARQLGAALETGHATRLDFHVWVDGRHFVRKIVETSARTTVTLVVTSVNQPVTITPPRAGQVGTLPAD